jgi:hypothetical protein
VGVLVDVGGKGVGGSVGGGVSVEVGGAGVAVTLGVGGAEVAASVDRTVAPGVNVSVGERNGTRGVAPELGTRWTVASSVEQATPMMPLKAKMTKTAPITAFMDHNWVPSSDAKQIIEERSPSQGRIVS